MKTNYQLWLDYYNGKIDKDKLTSRQQAEIRELEYQINKLVPTEQLLKLCSGYERMKKIYYLSSEATSIISQVYVSKLAEHFNVSEEIVETKMKTIILKHFEKEKNNTELHKNKRVLKKNKNIIHIDFS